MASNGITSSKAPRKRSARTPILSDAIPLYQGDPVMEANGGMKNRLADISAEPVANLSNATRDDLLRRAGIRVRRGRSNTGL